MNAFRMLPLAAVAGLLAACSGGSEEPAEVAEVDAPAARVDAEPESVAPSPAAEPEAPAVAAVAEGQDDPNAKPIMEDKKTWTTDSGLEIEVLTPGSGDEASAGQTVSVHYTGWLTDGTKFDSSVDRGQPFLFPLGGGRVIRGWDEGVAGMKVGEKRKLTIPSDLGYGPSGTPGGPIPPNATLVFEVELLAVR